jgi:hypothetical protein
MANPKVAPLTSQKIKSLAGKGLKAPSTLTTEEVREVCASVMEHILRQGA